MFSLIVPAYAEKFGVDEDTIKQVLARSPRRTTTTAPATPRAQFRKEMSARRHLRAPAVAGRLGVFDCAGVADGGAAAIVVRAEDAPQVHRQAALHQGAVVRRRQRLGPHRPRLRLHDLPRGRGGAQDAYAQAGVTDPRDEIAMAEVHDCFTPDRARAHGEPRGPP